MRLFLRFLSMFLVAAVLAPMPAAQPFPANKLEFSNWYLTAREDTFPNFANGNLADVVLFGSFLAWAVVALISAKRRPRPPAPTLPRASFNDAVAIVVGLGLYVAFVLWLHPILIGMPLVG